MPNPARSKRKLKKWVVPAAAAMGAAIIILAAVVIALSRQPTPSEKPIGFSFAENGKYGLMDMDGKVLIPAKYDLPIGDFRDGLACVCSDGKYGYIDLTGKYAINPQYPSEGEFREGLLCYEDEASGLFGYKDTDGATVIAPAFKKAGPFANGVAAVMKDNAWIYINRKGKQAFEGEYSYASPMLDKMVPVEKDGKFAYINQKGKLVLDYQPYTLAGRFVEGRAIVRGQDGKYGYINEKGDLVTPLEYDRAADFSEGLAVVSKDSRWGLINKNGLIQVDFMPCSGISPLQESRCFVADEKGKTALMDKNGKLLTTYQFGADYTLGGRFSEGLARVGAGNAVGFINTNGKYDINPQFEYASHFVNGRALVISQGKLGIIDRSGAWVMEPKYPAALPEPGSPSRVYEPVMAYITS